MNLLEFFELSSEPFANSPDGRFYFESAQHAQVMTRLRYVTDNMKGLAIVIGDIGAGKTTLARRFMETLSEDEYEAALLVVIHSSITSDWLLTKIAMQLGVAEPAADKVTLLGQLYGRLREIHEEGKRAVVLIDEAQMLQAKETMQELRGLLNLELPGRKLLSLVFFGLPDVEHTLALDPPLAQRVALKVHLQALPLSSTEEYVRHRLRVAGARQMPFSREAIAAVHRFSRGTPRVINTVCDNAMLEAFLLKRRTISEQLIAGAARDLGLTDGQAAPAAPPPPAPRAAADPLDPRLGARAGLPGPATSSARPGGPAPSPAGPVSGAPQRSAQAAAAPSAAARQVPGAPPGLAPARALPGAPPVQAARPSPPVQAAGPVPSPARALPPASHNPAPRPPAPAAGSRPAAQAAAPAKPAGEFEEFDDLLADLDKS